MEELEALEETRTPVDFDPVSQRVYSIDMLSNIFTSKHTYCIYGNFTYVFRECKLLKPIGIYKKNDPIDLIVVNNDSENLEGYTLSLFDRKWDPALFNSRIELNDLFNNKVYVNRCLTKLGIDIEKFLKIYNFWQVYFDSDLSSPDKLWKNHILMVLQVGVEYGEKYKETISYVLDLSSVDINPILEIKKNEYKKEIKELEKQLSIIPDIINEDINKITSGTKDKFINNMDSKSKEKYDYAKFNQNKKFNLSLIVQLVDDSKQYSFSEHIENYFKDNTFTEKHDIFVQNILVKEYNKKIRNKKEISDRHYLMKLAKLKDKLNQIENVDLNKFKDLKSSLVSDLKYLESFLEEVCEKIYNQKPIFTFQKYFRNQYSRKYIYLDIQNIYSELEMILGIKTNLKFDISEDFE